jgi:hypothetical protein
MPDICDQEKNIKHLRTKSFMSRKLDSCLLHLYENINTVGVLQKLKYQNV